VLTREPRSSLLGFVRMIAPNRQCQSKNQVGKVLDPLLVQGGSSD
jgi:hypothetical protein